MVKKRTFVTLNYGLASILPRVLGLISLPLITHNWSVQQFGEYQAVLALQPFFVAVFGFGITQAVYKYFNDSGEADERVIFGTSLLFQFISSFSFLIIAFLLSDLLSAVYNSVVFFPIIAIFIIHFFFLSWLEYGKRLLNVLGKSGQFRNVSIVSAVANLMVLLILILIHQLTLINYVIMTIGVDLFLLAYVAKNISFGTLVVSKSVLRRMFWFCLPIVPTMMTIWIVDFSDRIFIERMVGLENLALYSLAYRVASLILIVSAVFDLSFRPNYFKYSSEGRGKEYISSVFKWFFTLLTLLILIMILFAEEAVVLIFGLEFQSAGLLASIILLSNYFAILSGWVNRFYELAEFTSTRFLFVLLGAFLNLILNYILIDLFDVLGAGVATVLTMAVIFFFSKKWIDKRTDTLNLLDLRLLFVIILTAGLNYLIVDGLGVSISLAIGKVLFMIVVALILRFAFKGKVELFVIRSKSFFFRS